MHRPAQRVWCGVRFPSQARADRQPGQRFPRILNVECKRVLTCVGQRCISLNEAGRLAEQEVRKAQIREVAVEHRIRNTSHTGTAVEILVNPAASYSDLVRAMDDA